MIILLKDLADGHIDAVIMTETSNADDIQNSLYMTKENNPDWGLEDLIDGLPNDCKTYTRWSDIQTAYY